MKPILIDTLKDDFSNTAEFFVNIDGSEMKGWQVAKPLNYDQDYLSKKDREEMAEEVLAGRAIAVRYFSDLSDDEKSEYVKTKIDFLGNLGE